jgi:hypothetical protein
MSTEDRLIEAIESLTLDPDAFDHEAHVRLAFAYLSRYELFDALARCRGALRGLAEHHGAHGKYHETITCALVFLIHERMQQARVAEPRTPAGVSHGEPPGLEWEEFARANPDLLRWKEGAFFDYYPEEVIASRLARRSFVLPHPPSGVRWASPAARHAGSVAGHRSPAATGAP